MIQEIRPLIQSSIPKTVDVRLDLLKDPPAVKADRMKMQQIIMNLVINGAEAIPASAGGTVFVRTAVRELTQKDITEQYEELEPGPFVVMEVRDTGSGMDAETKAKIFDPFFTTKFTGRGLGLAATLGIVTSHHGALRVYSTPGKGSTFLVLLPATHEKAATPQRRVSAEELPRGHGTILLVDDDPLVQQVGERALGRAGYTVLLAESGEAAVKIFRDQRASISLVILDLNMPGMGGEETSQHLKSLGPAVPVILSSGYNEEEATRKFSDRELAGFLQKPYTVQRLLEKVKGVLAENQKRNGTHSHPR